MSKILVTMLVVFFVLLFRFGHVDLTLIGLSSVSLYVFNTTVKLLVANFSIDVAYVLNIIDLVNVLMEGNVVVLSCTRRLHHSGNLSMESTTFRTNRHHVHPVFLASTTTSMNMLPVVVRGGAL